MFLFALAVTLAAAPDSGATLRFDETWPSKAPRTISVLVDGKVVATETLDEAGNVEATNGTIPNGLARQPSKKEPTRTLSTVTYRNSQRSGEALTYFADGTLLRRRSYVAGKKDGLETEFTREGLKARMANFSEGLLDGTVTEFNDQGEPMSKTKYVAGRRQGEAQEFDALGRVERTQKWKDDKEDGPPTCFDGDRVITCDSFDDAPPPEKAPPAKPKPAPVAVKPAAEAQLTMRFVVEQGETVGTLIFDGDKLIAAELVPEDYCCAEVAKGSVPDGVITVLQGAKGKRKIGEVTYRDGARNGVTKVFYETGELAMVLPFVDGKREGVAEEYFQNGAVKARFTCRNGLIEGPLNEYYKNGKVSVTGQYKRGKLVGKEQFFAPDGRAISSDEWEELKAPPPPPVDEGFVDDGDDFGSDSRNARRTKSSNGSTCAVNSDCASGVCKGTRCASPAPRGAPCKWSSECASKKCNRNACW